MKIFFLVVFALCMYACSDDNHENAPSPAAVTAQPAPPVTPSVTTTDVAPELTFPSCEELNTLWKTRYHSKLKIGWALRDIACTGPSKDRVFAEAAYILENTIFRTDMLPPGVNIPPADMLTFITSKYNKVTIGNDEYPSTDVAFKIVYFYAAIENGSGFSVVGDLMHEARHADGWQYLHVKCIEGPMKGQTDCDNGIFESFTEGGPHTLPNLYFAWAAARSNWPNQWKIIVRDLSEYLVMNRINAPLETRQAWVNKYLISVW